MFLNKLLVNQAKQLLCKQENNGSFMPGHNGPYRDPETPVRNTAHYCICLLRAYEISSDQSFLHAAINCGSFLLSSKARPMSDVFFCRKNPQKDFSNGLVGQAWALEALIYLYKVTSDRQYLSLAKSVFLFHSYDEEHAAWYKRNVDGSYNGFDSTFNHQLWFAAVGSLLSFYDKSIKQKVIHFMNHLHLHLAIYHDGCIRHRSRFLLKEPSEILIGFFKDSFKRPSEKRYLRMKSIGYHGFNLYAFAILHSTFPNHQFWSEKKFNQALLFASQKSFVKGIEYNKFGFPYNPPGFEMAYAFQEFKFLPKEKIAEWVAWQIKKCFDFKTYTMTKGKTEDKLTSAARIYEAYRLDNYEIKIHKSN